MTETHAEHPPASQVPAQRIKGLERLLKIEREARQVETIQELAFLAANETADLIRGTQVFVFTGHARAMKVVAISSVGQVDRDAPRVRWIESVVSNLAADCGLDGTREFMISAYGKSDPRELAAHPYPNIAWIPFMLRDGFVFGGLLMACDRLWSEEEVSVGQRLAESYQHAWNALSGRRSLKRRRIMRPLLAAAAAALIGAGAYPVPLSIVAPVEVRSLNTSVVSAPMEGVVEEITVAAGERVKKGQVVARMRDSAFSSGLSVATRELGVTKGKLKQLTQLAGKDSQARAALSVARTEMELAAAKRDYAGELLRRATIVAPLDGLAIFADEQDVVGRPFATGQRILDIADPTRVRLRIDIPVADVLALNEGASVRAFLDSDPLHPYVAKITAASYEARLVENGSLAYRTYAMLEASDDRLPRLGVRGTAQVFGDDVPLAFYLFRKPIAAIRQHFGL
jgi:hypothetical protein